jgi:hypothetical protein
VDEDATDEGAVCLEVGDAATTGIIAIVDSRP